MKIRARRFVKAFMEKGPRRVKAPIIKWAPLQEVNVKIGAPLRGAPFSAEPEAFASLAPPLIRP